MRALSFRHFCSLRAAGGGVNLPSLGPLARGTLLQQPTSSKTLTFLPPAVMNRQFIRHANSEFERAPSPQNARVLGLMGSETCVGSGTTSGTVTLSHSHQQSHVVCARWVIIIFVGSSSTREQPQPTAAAQRKVSPANH